MVSVVRQPRIDHHHVGDHQSGKFSYSLATLNQTSFAICTLALRSASIPCNTVRLAEQNGSEHGNLATMPKKRKQA
jgi:hypothetical protein